MLSIGRTTTEASPGVVATLVVGALEAWSSVSLTSSTGRSRTSAVPTTMGSPIKRRTRATFGSQGWSADSAICWMSSNTNHPTAIYAPNAHQIDRRWTSRIKSLRPDIPSYPSTAWRSRSRMRSLIPSKPAWKAESSRTLSKPPDLMISSQTAPCDHVNPLSSQSKVSSTLPTHA